MGPKASPSAEISCFLYLLVLVLLSPSANVFADSSLKRSPKLTESALQTKKPMRFWVNLKQTSQLNGREGTILRLKPGSLVYEDGSAPTSKRVELRMWEFYTCFDMLNAGLITQSGKRILETAGMIYVEAEIDGQPLTLAKGANLGISMPAPKGMSMFRGIEKDGVIDWQLESALDSRPEKRNPLLSNDLRLVRTPRSEQHLKQLALQAPLGQQNQRFDQQEYFTGQMGWINCDRFNRREMMAYEVLLDCRQLPKRTGKIVKTEDIPEEAAALLGLETERVVAIFMNTRGIMQATRTDSERFVVNVPVIEPFRLMAIKHEGGQLYAGLSEPITLTSRSLRFSRSSERNSISIPLEKSSKEIMRHQTARFW